MLIAFTTDDSHFAVRLLDNGNTEVGCGPRIRTCKRREGRGMHTSHREGSSTAFGQNQFRFWGPWAAMSAMLFTFLDGAFRLAHCPRV